MIWFKRYWRKLAIAGLALAGIVCVLVTLRRRGQYPKAIVSAIDHHAKILAARDEAAQLRSQLGVVLAEERVREQYAADIAKLDAEERQRIDELKGRPEELAEAALLVIAKQRKRREG